MAPVQAQVHQQGVGHLVRWRHVQQGQALTRQPVSGGAALGLLEGKLLRGRKVVSTSACSDSDDCS